MEKICRIPHNQILNSGPSDAATNIIKGSGNSLNCVNNNPEDIFTTEIDGGKYAVCKIKGVMVHTFQAFRIVNDEWLPTHVYRVKQLNVFEELLQNPLKVSYNKIERVIHIPVEPVG